MGFIQSFGQILMKGITNNLALLQHNQCINLQQPTRSVVLFSKLSGKRKTVKTITKRFFRLDWGAWIRPISGRNNGLWKKSISMKKKCKTHVFCNSTQSRMFDKMVTKYWRTPKYYVDDIYEPYQKRDNFWITRGGDH